MIFTETEFSLGGWSGHLLLCVLLGGLLLLLYFLLSFLPSFFLSNRFICHVCVCMHAHMCESHSVHMCTMCM